MIAKKILPIIGAFILINMIFSNSVSANIFTKILNTQSYPISGKVTNLRMEPIEGVKITFEPQGLLGINARTDSLGNYSTAVSKNGDCWVTISKIGYKTIRMKTWVGTENIFNYTLDPDKYPIAGKVTNRQGEPIEGVQITFEPNGGKNGIIIAVTDQLGNYSTGVSELGDCWVTITKDGYTTFRTKTWIGKENTFNYTL